MYVKVDSDILEIFNDHILFIVEKQIVDDPVHPHQVKIYLRNQDVIDGYLTDFTYQNTIHLFMDKNQIDVIHKIMDSFVGEISKYKRRLNSLMNKLSSRLFR